MEHERTRSVVMLSWQLRNRLGEHRALRRWILHACSIDELLVEVERQQRVG